MGPKTGVERNQRGKTIDWPRVRADYEAGQLPVTEIRDIHGVSRKSIYQRAKAEGWNRAAVQEQVAARVETLIQEGRAIPPQDAQPLDDEEPLESRPSRASLVAAVAVEEEALRRVQVIRRQRMEPDILRTVLVRALKILGRDHASGKDPLDEDVSLAFELLKCAKISSETVQNIHALERHLWRLDDGRVDTDGFIQEFHAEIRAAREAGMKTSKHKPGQGGGEIE